MTEYRHRETGEIKTQGQWRRVHLNTSFPRVWTDETLEFLKVDPVLSVDPPTPGKFQKIEKNGAIQDENGNWVENWELVPMFSEYTDEEGVTHTVAEQEAMHQANLDVEAAYEVRERRDQALRETDYLALSDNTLSEEMAVYRQALRDITSHENFPHLNTVDWPTKPAV